LKETFSPLKIQYFGKEPNLCSLSKMRGNLKNFNLKKLPVSTFLSKFFPKKIIRREKRERF